MRLKIVVAIGLISFVALVALGLASFVMTVHDAVRPKSPTNLRAE